MSSLLRGEEPAADSALWGRLADALGIPNTSVEKSKPTGERLGGLLVESGLADHVRGVIESQVDSCIDLDSLAELICANAGNPRLTVGKVLSLLALASHNREPVLALRTHLFINEAKTAQLCLYPKCEAVPRGADAWWRRLYVAHHTSCDVCNSRMYSVFLCRRCGFVYLEGWSAHFVLWPERDCA